MVALTDEVKCDGCEAVEVVRREDWNAVGPTSKQTNTMPVQEVYFCHTNTKTCSSRAECVHLLQAMQAYQIEIMGLSDIAYHFLVGGDGRVYEGRGWFTMGEELPKNSKVPQDMRGKYIDIAFIGKFEDDNEPPQVMQDAANSLIAYGMDNTLLENEDGDGQKTDATDQPKDEQEDTDTDEEKKTPTSFLGSLFKRIKH